MPNLSYILPFALLVLLAGCQLKAPDIRAPETKEPQKRYQANKAQPLQATLIYWTLEEKRRIATISLTRVITDEPLEEDAKVHLQQTNQELVVLTNRADGIYADPAHRPPELEEIRLVAGRDLTDPVLSVTPVHNFHVLSYIAMQGRKPVLKLRTIDNGKVAKKAVVLHLAKSVDSYLISDFIRQEAP